MILRTSLPITDSFRAEYLEYYRILPLEVLEGRLRVAAAGSPAREVIEDLERTFEAPVQIVEAEVDDIIDSVRSAFSAAESTDALIRSLDAEDGAAEAIQTLEADARDLANQPPVVRYVNLLIREAFEARASDIHVEATEQGPVVRFRVDGVLTPATAPPRSLQSAVVSRLKLIADLDIAERRLPQDGRIRIRLEERDLDLRVSTVPTLFGQSIVLRLLDHGRGPEGLDSLGMPEGVYGSFAEVARKSDPGARGALLHGSHRRGAKCTVGGHGQLHESRHAGLDHRSFQRSGHHLSVEHHLEPARADHQS